MILEFEISGSTGVLTLAGELTIGHTTKLKGALLTCLVRTRQVTVELSRLTTLDLSCLQVLCSAHRSFRLQNKVLSVSGDGHAILRKAALRAGFFDGRICDFCPEASCLWAIGGK